MGRRALLARTRASPASGWMPCPRCSRTRFAEGREDPARHERTYGDPNIDGSLTENLPEVHKVMRRSARRSTNSFPGNRVLIGETYLPNIAGAAEVVRRRTTTSCSCRWTCRSASSTSWTWTSSGSASTKWRRHRRQPAAAGLRQPRQPAHGCALRRRQAQRGHRAHAGDDSVRHAQHSADVLRRRDRDEDHAADAHGRREGSGRQDGLAAGKGPRRRAHADAVGWLAGGRLYHRATSRGCRFRTATRRSMWRKRYGRTTRC